MLISFPTTPNAVVTQKFNNYNPTMYGGDGRHKGIDYGVPVKTQVYACMEGRIIATDVSETGYGRHIRIEHEDGSISIYAHLSEFKVNTGDYVNAGNLIGLSGGDPKDNIKGDGYSTGPHLHWEIRPPGRTATDQGAVDPEKYCLMKEGVPYKKAIVKASNGLRIRNAPVNGAVIGMLKDNEEIEILELFEGWARIRSLRDEWCHADYIQITEEVPGSKEPVIDESEEIRDIIESLNAALIRLEKLL